MITEKQMMHGVDYEGDDVTGWLMSEKLDGCRAYWDGATMWSRGGMVINIPAAMRDVLPAGVSLDGEIHAGRDGYEITRRAVQYNQWTGMEKFSVFDAPQYPGAFQDRYSFLSELLPFEGVVNYINHEYCFDIDAAADFMREIQAAGGEGVMLRHPDNEYRRGRTEQILKLKRWPL